MNLRFVLYDEGRPSVRLSKRVPDNVIIAGNNWLLWTKRPRTGQDSVEEYEIGVGVRVPGGHEFWGLMMVIDLNNPCHLSNYARSVQELRSGQLT